MGGKTENPTYREVCRGDTNHVEVIEIYFDENIVSFKDLLSVFWENHNPTTPDQQGADIGTQYRSVIFYNSDEQKKKAKKSAILHQDILENKIVTQIIPSSEFYRAEEYHQNYLNKKNIDSCGL